MPGDCLSHGSGRDTIGVDASVVDRGRCGDAAPISKPAGL